MTPVHALRPEDSSHPSRDAHPALHGLLLAGNWKIARNAALPAALGVPPAAVPIDAAHGIAALWRRRFSESGFRCTLGIAHGRADEASFYAFEPTPDSPDPQVHLWSDVQSHRGAAGTVRDYAHWLEERLGERIPGIVVVEGSVYQSSDCQRILGMAAQPATESFVVVTQDAAPSGISYLSREAIDRIPRVGYYDLKEQLVPALHAAGAAARPVWIDGFVSRILDRESYLEIVATRARAGGAMISPSAAVDPTVELHGCNLIGPASRIGAGALLSNSVVLSSAIVEEGATVARSVIPPGVRVRRGENVIDRIVEPLSIGGSPS